MERSILDDVIFCKCGRIHVVSGKDYSEAVKAGKENLLICGNCGATYIFGAEKTDDGYSLYRDEIPECLMKKENNYSVDLTNCSLKKIHRMNYSIGYLVPMVGGYLANAYFCGRFFDEAHGNNQRVDVQRFINMTPDPVIRLVVCRRPKAFDWSNTQYAHKTV